MPWAPSRTERVEQGLAGGSTDELRLPLQDSLGQSSRRAWLDATLGVEQYIRRWAAEPRGDAPDLTSNRNRSLSASGAACRACFLSLNLVPVVNKSLGVD